MTGYEERSLDTSMHDIEYKREDRPGVWVLFKEMRILLSA